MAEQPIFLYAATYDDYVDAQEEYEIVKRLHKDHIIGTYDAAVIGKDAEGKVTVRKHEKPTQHGAWTGVVVGAVVGIVFPPSLIGMAIVGGGVGALVGHLWGGLSRTDMKEIGELLDEGEAALIVVGKDKVDVELDKALHKAKKTMQKELHVDTQELEKHVDAAAEEQAASPE